MKKQIDSIPLTTISDDASAIESFHSTDTGMDAERQTDTTRKKVGGRRSLRVNSTYISHNNRLSRYKTAFSSFLPFRSQTSTTSHELPIDNIGCFSNLSFSWVRDFLIQPHEEMSDGSRRIIIDLPYLDRANVNGKRLLEIYKGEKQSRGTKDVSMLNVAWKFCKSRVIVASIFWTLSIVCYLLAPVIFLRTTLEALSSETRHLRNETILNGTEIELPVQPPVQLFKIFAINFKFYGRFYAVGQMSIFIAFLFAAKFLASITTWLNLRTTIRFRIGLIAATYEKALKSSIMNNIAPHQILNDDIEILMDFVNHLTKIVGTVIALILSFVASIILLGTPGVWPIFASIGFFCGPIILAKLSRTKMRKSSHYLQKKIALVHDFCINFKDVIVHSLSYEYIKHFYYLNAAQFTAMRYSKLYSAEIYEGSTSILLGGLYLIWCDANINSDSVETLVLLLIYVYFIRNFLFQYCHSIQGIENSRGSLDKIKNSFEMPINSRISRPIKTIDTRVLFSMNDCRFEWSKNKTFTMEIMKKDVVGICGKNMKAMIYSMLGHTECKDGILRQRGVIGFFSEHPFLCIGSIKDNILMGAEFDAKRYYAAVNLTNLNDDVLQSVGADEQPIENIDLNLQQKQRIALARAIYCDRDIYLFDEPFKSAFFSSHVIVMFSNVIKSIISDPNKAVVICSSNNHILNICEKIYDTTDSKSYSRAEYERMSSISYDETPVQYTYESIKGCNPDSLPMAKAPSRFHVQLVQEHGSTDVLSDESVEHLISRRKKYVGYSPGVLNLIFISLITALNGSAYILFILGFIFVVMKSYVEPWLNLVFLGGFVFTFIVEVILRIYFAKLLEIRQKKISKSIFEKLLITTVDYLCATNIADILTLFSVSLDVQPYALIIKSVILLFLAGFLLILCNFWLTSAIIIIIFCGQIFSIHFILKHRIASTLNYFSSLEYETRKKMLSFLINNMRGRDVIQSFERISEFCKEFNYTVEDNSAAVFIQKSTKYYAQFIIEIILLLNVTVLILTSLFIGEITIYSYILSIILYYIIIHHANELASGYFDYISMQCRQRQLNQEISNIVTMSEVSLLYVSSQIENMRDGLSLEFKDVRVKLCGKKVLEIPKLKIERCDKIGFTGNGAHFITSILFKLLRPASGSITIESHDLNVINQDSLAKIVSVVSHDLRIPNVSISDFLNPSNSIPYKKISSKIQEYLPGILQLPNKTSEKLKILSRKDTQILCLIRSALRPQIKLVIVEFPEIEILGIINAFIRSELKDKTVIIIGTNQKQFEICNRIHKIIS